MPRNTLNRLVVVLILGFSAVALAACGGAQARKAKHLEKGQAFLAAGNLEKARVEFQNALQIAPTDPEARFENGVVDEKLGKIREAAAFYQGAIDISPSNVGARTGLARLMVFSAQADKALELIKPGLAAHPDDAELLTLRAAVHVQQKDLDAALMDAQRAVQLDPQNPDAVATLAGVYSSMKSNDKAQAVLEDGLKRLPGSVDLHLALAQVYGTENQPEGVERILLELVKLRPSEKAHRIRLALFYASQKQVDSAERSLRDGIKALPEDRELKLTLIDFIAARRSPEAAEKELIAMVAQDTKDFEMKFALAKFYERSKHPDKAESLLQQVIGREGLDAAGLAARDRLALLRAERKDLPGAEQLIGEVLTKSPRDNDALLLRGTLALDKGDPKAAIADLRTVLRDQPNSPGVLGTLARAHMMNGEPAIAEETMRRAVEANPKDSSLRLDLARLLAQLKKPDQAKPLLESLVKDQPNNTAALEVLFGVSVEAKDYATARSTAEALVANQPKQALGYLYEGMIAENDKHWDEAARLYGQAADLQPDALDPLQAQIKVLLLQKRLPEAMKRLDDVIAREPKAPLAPSIKGNLMRAEGHLQESEALYRMAIVRAPTWWVPYVGLADAQFSAKDPDAALATLLDAQKSVTQGDQLALRIAAYYERSGKIDDAIHEYDSILSKNPQLDVAANNLAMLLVTYGKDSPGLDRAKALTARFKDSANLSYLDTYAWVLYKHGDAAASVPIFERVVSRAPDEPLALYHLGMAQSQSGAPAEARDNLSRAIKSGAKFAGLDEAKATLDRLASAAPKT